MAKNVLNFPKIRENSISFGIDYRFKEYSDISFIRVLKSEIYSHEYLISEHTDNNQKLIGKINFQNVFDKPLRGYLYVESDDKSVFYKSGLVELKPNESHTFPILLRVLDKNLKDSFKQISATFRFNEDEITLLNIPVTIFERSVWNGSIETLSSFINPSDSRIVKNIGTIQYQLSKKNITNSYTRLKEAVNWFVKFGTIYKKDEIKTYEYDHVQNVSKTIQLGYGDCEDLAVLYSSYLLGLGIETVFIDFENTKSANHVFLLVNTNLSPEEMQIHGLNELNSIVREDRFGVPRLWVALEVNEIQNGFTVAHKKGAIQLYKETIVKNEPVNFIPTRNL